MTADQPTGDRRAGTIEFRRAVARLAQKDDAAIGKAVEERGKIVIDIAEGFGKAGNQGGGA